MEDFLRSYFLGIVSFSFSFLDGRGPVFLDAVDVDMRSTRYTICM